MAYDFGRFFQDAGNTLQQAGGGAATGAGLGSFFGPVGTAVGGVVGGLFGVGKSIMDNSQRNTLQDQEGDLRQQAATVNQQQAVQAQGIADQAAGFQRSIAERFAPVIQGLDDDRRSASLRANQSYANRGNEYENYKQSMAQGRQTIEGLQGQGQYGALARSVQDQANPFANGGMVDTATSARAGSDFANQQAALTSRLAERGLLGGPGEAAAMASVSGQQGQAMFDAGLSRFMDQAAFETDRQQQMRDYQEAGGTRSDNMALAQAEVYRDPAVFNAAGRMYDADQNVYQAANQQNMQGNQMYNQAQLAGLDASGMALRAMDGSRLGLNQEADRLRESAGRYGGNETPEQFYGGLSRFAQAIPKGAYDQGAQAVGTLQSRLNRYMGQGRGPQRAGQITAPDFTVKKPQDVYEQPNGNPRPGVGGRQAGGAGVPYQSRI